MAGPSPSDILSATTPALGGRATAALVNPGTPNTVSVGMPSGQFDPIVQNLGGVPMRKSQVDAVNSRLGLALGMLGPEAGEGTAVQRITSADTSIKQIPGLFKSSVYEAPAGGRNLDIGGGKYDLGKDYLKSERGVESHVYDPFNRAAEHNSQVLNNFKAKPADTVTAANVLNVIAEPEARQQVMQQAYDHLRPGGKAYFDIYEGSKTGAGKATSKGWQNNRAAGDYLDEVRTVFPDAYRKGTVIVAPKPAGASAPELVAARNMQNRTSAAAARMGAAP